MKNIFLLACALLLGLSAGQTALAASLNVYANKTTAVAGDPVDFTVTIGTDGVPVNAAQATIQFPPENFTIVSVDTSDSIFSFWADGPAFFNETGRVIFLGGASNGFNGQSLRVLRVRAVAKGAGVATVDFADVTMASSDGSNVDVPTESRGTSVTVTALPVPETPPEQIEREPTVSAVLPAMPNVEVPLYPDPALWYNALSPFLVKWDLPSDISAVATTVNKTPEYDPTVSEGLFDNKVFRPLEDGVWYLHVRFRNNVGWGETRNVRVAIDTIPPEAFQAGVEPAMISDTPTPVITFDSSDQLSGMRGYSVQVDNDPSLQTTEKTLDLPPLSPGEHVVRVSAVDQAGNSTNASVDITTIPIMTPTITPISTLSRAGDGKLIIGGTALPGSRITINFWRKSGEFVGASEAFADAGGMWTARFEQPLKAGEYAASAVATDDRGAKSIAARASFQVVRPPFLTLLGVEVSQAWFFSSILTLLLIGFGVGWEVQRKKKERRGWHIVIAEREVGSAFDQLEGDLEAMVGRNEKKVVGEREATEMVQIAKRLDERIHRVRQFILDNIEEINK